MSIDRCHTRPGFTLAEATIAMVILGIAAAGVLLPFAGGAAVQAEGVHRTLATGLANDLMERILATPYADMRATWNGYTEAPGQVRDATGVVLADPAYAAFSRNATCDYVYVRQQGGPPIPPNYLLITVQVRRQDRELVSLTSLVSE